MNLRLSLLAFVAVLVAIPQQAMLGQRRGAPPSTPAAPLPAGVRTRDVNFYSEGVQCYGKVFFPPDYLAEGKVPAVVVAPGWGETTPSIEQYAALFAARGMVAMAIDYRGWGKSGGYLQTIDPVRTDDRLRFSQLTAKVRIQRKRLLPQHQVLDIRNALYYLQGEPGVDRSRVGVWGTDMAAGHVIVIAAVDARVKAAVAQVPLIDGREKVQRASAPTGTLLRAEQRRARTGQSPPLAAGASDPESQLALSEYHPFWSVDQIPAKTAVLFVLAEKDLKASNEDAIAASKLLKGPTEVFTVPGAMRTELGRGTALEAAAKAAVEWFLKYL